MHCKQILSKPHDEHPYGTSLYCNDKVTLNLVPHRDLILKNYEIFMDFTVDALETHHKDASDLTRLKNKIHSLRSKGLDVSKISPYPRSDSVRKANFAEVVLAEYLKATTGSILPIYKLRYNPNRNQSMKGDDTLLFDLDSDPIRIIVGEAKFRKTSSKQAVTEIISGLIRSEKDLLPTSLIFVSDMLYKEGKDELGGKVLNCVDMILEDKINIEYVGFLLSDEKASERVKEHATELRNLLMISLGQQSPEKMVYEAFEQLEAKL